MCCTGWRSRDAFHTQGVSRSNVSRVKVCPRIGTSPACLGSFRTWSAAELWFGFADMLVVHAAGCVGGNLPSLQRLFFRGTVWPCSCLQFEGVALSQAEINVPWETRSAEFRVLTPEHQPVSSSRSHLSSVIFTKSTSRRRTGQANLITPSGLPLFKCSLKPETNMKDVLKRSCDTDGGRFLPFQVCLQYSPSRLGVTGGTQRVCQWVALWLTLRQQNKTQHALKRI